MTGVGPGTIRDQVALAIWKRIKPDFNPRGFVGLAQARAVYLERARAAERVADLVAEAVVNPAPRP